MIKRKGNVYKLDTPSTTLLIRAETSAEYLYYGESLSVPGSDYDCLRLAGDGSGAALSPASFFGDSDVRRCSVVCEPADGALLSRFSFLRAKLTEKPVVAPLPASYSDSDRKNAGQTLCLEFLDEPSKLRLFLYYTVFDDSDVIAVSSRLYNGGKKEVRVRSLASLQMDLYGGGYSLVSFREDGRACVSAPLSDGGFLLNERAGTAEGDCFAMLKKEGGVYAFGLLYAGGCKETVEQNAFRTRVVAGMNDFLPDRPLAPGEDLFSPEALMTFSADEDGVFCALRDFFDGHLLRGRWKGKERPVTAVARTSALALGGENAIGNAEAAAGLGAELFFLDERISSDAETGELAALSEAVRGAGMKLGIRMAPEEVPEGSEICKKHPELVAKPLGGETSGQGVFMLRLADPRTQRYLVRAVSALVSETKAAYVRWECPSPVCGGSGRGLPSGEFLRHTEGFYAVLAKLTEKFPAVFFDTGVGCGGFAGLRFMPQGRAAELVSRLFGTFGAEADMREATDGERERLKERISFYKKYRRLFRCGGAYRLDASPTGSGVCGALFTTENKSAAVAFVEVKAEGLPGACAIAFKGLDERGMYAVSARKTEASGKEKVFAASGELLMKGLVPLKNILPESFFEPSFESVRTGIVVAEKIKKTK